MNAAVKKLFHQQTYWQSIRFSWFIGKWKTLEINKLLWESLQPTSRISETTFNYFCQYRSRPRDISNRYHVECSRKWEKNFWKQISYVNSSDEVMTDICRRCNCYAKIASIYELNKRELTAHRGNKSTWWDCALNTETLRLFGLRLVRRVETTKSPELNQPKFSEIKKSFKKKFFAAVSSNFAVENNADCSLLSLF